MSCSELTRKYPSATFRIAVTYPESSKVEISRHYVMVRYGPLVRSLKMRYRIEVIGACNVGEECRCAAGFAVTRIVVWRRRDMDVLVQLMTALTVLQALLSLMV